MNRRITTVFHGWIRGPETVASLEDERLMCLWRRAVALDVYFWSDRTDPGDCWERVGVGTYFTWR